MILQDLQMITFSFPVDFTQPPEFFGIGVVRKFVLKTFPLSS